MLKFVIDEDMPRTTAPVLRNYGYEVKDIRDFGLRGAQDSEIFEFAQKNQSVIITGDRGFGNILRFPMNTHYGIVVANFVHETSTNTINDLLISKLLQLKEEDFKGNIIIVDEMKIRIRKKT